MFIHPDRFVHLFEQSTIVLQDIICSTVLGSIATAGIDKGLDVRGKLVPEILNLTHLTEDLVICGRWQIELLVADDQRFERTVEQDRGLLQAAAVFRHCQPGLNGKRLFRHFLTEHPLATGDIDNC